MNREKKLKQRLSLLLAALLVCGLTFSTVACQSRDEGGGYGSAERGAGYDEPAGEGSSWSIGQPGDGVLEPQPTGQSPYGREGQLGADSMGQPGADSMGQMGDSPMLNGGSTGAVVPGESGTAQVGQPPGGTTMGQPGGTGTPIGQDPSVIAGAGDAAMSASGQIAVDPSLVSLCQIAEPMDAAAVETPTFFTPDGAQLTEEGRERLDQVAQCLNGEQLGTRGIEVAILSSGEAGAGVPSQSPMGANGEQLSPEHAQSVADYLEAQGVKVERVGTNLDPSQLQGQGGLPQLPAQGQSILIRLVS